MKSLADFFGVQDIEMPSKPPTEAKPEDLTIKELCRGILTSKDYLESVYQRIRLHSLPPAVERELYDRAYGKSTEHIELNDKTHMLEDAPIEDIEARIQFMLGVVRTLRAKERGTLEDDDTVPGVH